MSLISRTEKSRIRIRKAVLGIRGSGSVPKYNTGSKMWSGVRCGVEPTTTPRPLLGMSLIWRPEKSRIRIRKAVLGIRGSGSVPKYNTGSKMWSGTYHNTATLVGNVPDLEAQLRVLGGRHQLSLDILHLVLVQLALRLPLRTSAIIEW